MDRCITSPTWSPPPPCKQGQEWSSPKSDQHQFSRNNINTLLRESVVRINQNDHLYFQIASYQAKPTR